MRHQKKGHKLGRTASHRKATLAALSSALIEHKRITTTVAKAKALRPFVEPLITRAKDDTTHNRRQVFRRLQNKHAISELFSDVAEQVADRSGGYTRVIKLGKRFGDGTEMAMVELVDYNDVKPEGSSGGSSGTRRGGGKGRRRKKKRTEAASAPDDTATKPESAPKEETSATEEPGDETTAGPDEETKQDASEAEAAETKEGESTSDDEASTEPEAGAEEKSSKQKK